MKKWLMILVYLMGVVTVNAQVQSLPISAGKTSCLLFPAKIQHVDMGSRNVLVQQVEGKENFLLVKADKADFEPTTLHIITEDGSLYSFLVKYEDTPWNLVWKFGAAGTSSLELDAANILDNPKTMKGLRRKNLDIMVRIEGIYIKANTIFYQLVIENQGPIDYEIERLGFYEKDRAKGKRTAVQEIELLPKYVAGEKNLVAAGSCVTMVYAMEKLTVPDQKMIRLVINERNGGRHIVMRIRNHKIIKGISLPSQYEK